MGTKICHLLIQVIYMEQKACFPLTCRYLSTNIIMNYHWLLYYDKKKLTKHNGGPSAQKQAKSARRVKTYDLSHCFS